jgi:hypothetical protein
MDARFQQFFNSNRAHALQFSFGCHLESIQGILRNTGFLFDVVVAACFHTKANLKAVFPADEMIPAAKDNQAIR